MFHVYILQSLKDGSFYIGQTNNLVSRVARHNKGLQKFTKKHLPYKIIYSEEYLSRSDAVKRETQLKSYKGGNAFQKLIADFVIKVVPPKAGSPLHLS